MALLFGAASGAGTLHYYSSSVLNMSTPATGFPFGWSLDPVQAPNAQVRYRRSNSLPLFWDPHSHVNIQNSMIASVILLLGLPPNSRLNVSRREEA